MARYAGVSGISMPPMGAKRSRSAMSVDREYGNDEIVVEWRHGFREG